MLYLCKYTTISSEYMSDQKIWSNYEWVLVDAENPKDAEAVLIRHKERIDPYGSTVRVAYVEVQETLK